MTNARKFGDILFNVLTEEPQFVLWPTRYFTLVRRPVMDGDGITYKFGLFLNAELETLQEQTARTIANIQARNNIAGAGLDLGGDLGQVLAQFKKPS